MPNWEKRCTWCLKQRPLDHQGFCGEACRDRERLMENSQALQGFAQSLENLCANWEMPAEVFEAIHKLEAASKLLRADSVK